MCGLKQGMQEPIKAYYEWMADIAVKLEQYHRDRFCPRELSMVKKDCFYVGLKEHNKYLVSHMKDSPQYGRMQMLKEICEQEDSWYWATITQKQNNDIQACNTSHYDRKNPPFDKGHTYAVKPTDLLLPNPAAEEQPSFDDCDCNQEDWYDELCSHCQYS